MQATTVLSLLSSASILPRAMQRVMSVDDALTVSTVLIALEVERGNDGMSVGVHVLIALEVERGNDGMSVGAR